MLIPFMNMESALILIRQWALLGPPVGSARHGVIRRGEMQDGLPLVAVPLTSAVLNVSLHIPFQQAKVHVI